MILQVFSFVSRLRFSAIAVPLVLSITGCGLAYRIDVQQGNVVSAEQLAQLKPGMTRDQTRFLLGTPLVADIFHERQWDYVYWLKQGRSGKLEQRRLTVYFGTDDTVERFVADTGMQAVQPEPGSAARAYDLGSVPAGEPQITEPRKQEL